MTGLVLSVAACMNGLMLYVAACMNAELCRSETCTGHSATSETEL